MFRAMDTMAAILVYWCSVSSFMWGSALDRQLWCSSIISHNITIITHNQHTDIYPLLTHKIYLFLYSFIYLYEFYANIVKMKTVVEGRTTLWWLCLVRLKLFFFQYHGDPKPRLIADIADAQVEIHPEYTNRTVVRTY